MSATVPTNSTQAEKPPKAGHIPPPGQTNSNQAAAINTQEFKPNLPPVGANLAQVNQVNPELEQKGFAESIDSVNKGLFYWANIGQVFGNIASFVTKFPFFSKFKDIGDKLGQWTSKLFFLVNGATNALKQIAFRNYTSFLGYLVYVINGLFVPQNKAYMVNGFGVGLTQLANQVNNINGKSSFKDVQDHFSNLFSGLAKLFRECKNPIKALKDGKPVLGVAGGIAALIGSTMWAMTGDEKAAAVVRDTGGATLDLEQISKHQWKYKRFNYIKSGAYYIVGTVFDLLSKFVKPLEPFFRPLCFLFDGLGRYYQAVSERKKELSNEHLSASQLAEIEARHSSKNANIVGDAGARGAKELTFAAA